MKNKRGGADAQGASKKVKELGRDGITTMVDAERAMRAREICQPTDQMIHDATDEVPHLLARITGKPRRS